MSYTLQIGFMQDDKGHRAWKSIRARASEIVAKDYSAMGGLIEDDIREAVDNILKEYNVIENNWDDDFVVFAAEEDAVAFLLTFR